MCPYLHRLLTLKIEPFHRRTNAKVLRVYDSFVSIIGTVACTIGFEWAFCTIVSVLTSFFRLVGKLIGDCYNAFVCYIRSDVYDSFVSRVTVRYFRKIRISLLCDRWQSEIDAFRCTHERYDIVHAREDCIWRCGVFNLFGRPRARTRGTYTHLFSRPTRLPLTE